MASPVDNGGGGPPRNRTVDDTPTTTTPIVSEADVTDDDVEVADAQPSRAGLGDLFQRVKDAATKTAEDAALLLPSAKQHRETLKVMAEAFAHPRLTSINEPHLGLGFWVVDFDKLKGADDAQLEAVAAYHDPNFPRLPFADKRATIEAMTPLLEEGTLERLEAFHFPLEFPGTSKEGVVLTAALEHETSVAESPALFDYYAPSKDGRLDLRALPNDVVDEASRRKMSPKVWGRMSTEQRAKGLRWKDLTHVERYHYYFALQSALQGEDPPKNLELYRITDPKVAPTGVLAPETFDDKLSWESARMTTATDPETQEPVNVPGTCEFITKTYYESRDQFFADLQWIHNLRLDLKPAIHSHNVLEFANADEVADKGPKLVGLQGIVDLVVFVDGATNMYNVMENRQIEVCQADGLAACSKSLATGVIDQNVLDVHKLHGMGIRSGIYGEGLKLGLELRGVRDSAPELLMTLQHLIPLLMLHRLDRMPPPPWEGWNAGEKELATNVYKNNKKNPKFKDVAKKAHIDFQTLADEAAEAPANAFRYLSPLWSFDKLPFIDEAFHEPIKAARNDFIRGMYELSGKVAAYVKSEEEIPDDFIRGELLQLNLRFMQASQLQNATITGLINLAVGGEA